MFSRCVHILGVLSKVHFLFLDPMQKVMFYVANQFVPVCLNGWKKEVVILYFERMLSGESRD